MTKKRFLELLEDCGFDDEPLLVEYREQHYVRIGLKFPNVFRARPVIHTFSMTSGNSDRRLTEHWIKYNRWLNKWYVDNSPGPHLSRPNEYRTQLRVAGYDEAAIDRYVELQKAVG